MLQKVFTIIYLSLYFLLYPDVHSPFLLYCSFLTHYNKVVYLYSLEFSSLWLLNNCVTPIGIPNETHMSEDSKLISIVEDIT